MSIGLTIIRTIPIQTQNPFPGKYKANGYTIGWRVRWEVGEPVKQIL